MRKHINLDKLKRLKQYERDCKAVIKDYKFEPGSLVLVRNTAVESSLDKKMKPRYFGPMVVVATNKGGSYILAELTGAVWQQKVAKFRVIPYFAREKIDIPEGILSVIDMSLEGLERIQNGPEDGIMPEILERDYLMDEVNLKDSDEESDEEDTVSDIIN